MAEGSCEPASFAVCSRAGGQFGVFSEPTAIFLVDVSMAVIVSALTRRRISGVPRRPLQASAARGAQVMAIEIAVASSFSLAAFSCDA